MNDAIRQAGELLAAAAVVVVPTETRYGLLARVDQPAALRAISVLKGREAAKPMAVFVRDREEMASIAKLTPTARKLADRFLPGPLTLVLEARVSWKAPLVQNNLIGLRYSSSPVIDTLLQTAGVPLTATSANLAGEPEAENLSEIMAIFGDQVRLYLDGGRLAGPVTTVVDASSENWRILRQGAIAEADIASCLKESNRG